MLASALLTSLDLAFHYFYFLKNSLIPLPANLSMSLIFFALFFSIQYWVIRVLLTRISPHILLYQITAAFVTMYMIKEVTSLVNWSAM